MKENNNSEKKDYSVPQITESYAYTRAALYVKTTAIGALRGASSIIFEHPWDMSKTYAQANPHLSSWQVITTIYNQNGLRSFYSGAIPNTARVVFKQGYRYPLQFFLISSYDNLFSDDFNSQYPRAKKIATGVTLAGLETYLITPLEKLKVWLMTNPDQQKKLINFFQINQTAISQSYMKALIHKSYNGHQAVMYKQCISWCTFLWFDDKLKSIACKMAGSEKLSYLQLMMIGLGVGVLNTAAIMPFDTLKTRIQRKVNPEPPPQGFLGVPRRIIEIVRTEGVKAPYKGTFFRLIQYTTQAIITVQILDSLERQFKNIGKKPKQRDAIVPVHGKPSTKLSR